MQKTEVPNRLGVLSEEMALEEGLLGSHDRGAARVYELGKMHTEEHPVEKFSLGSTESLDEPQPGSSTSANRGGPTMDSENT